MSGKVCVGFGQQLVCQAAEQGNYQVAAANAESVEALASLVNTLNDIGRRQQDLAEFQLDELERDRRTAEMVEQLSQMLCREIVASLEK